MNDFLEVLEFDIGKVGLENFWFQMLPVYLEKCNFCYRSVTGLPKLTNQIAGIGFFDQNF